MAATEGEVVQGRGVRVLSSDVHDLHERQHTRTAWELWDGMGMRYDLRTWDLHHYGKVGIQLMAWYRTLLGPQQDENTINRYRTGQEEPPPQRGPTHA